MKYRGTKVIFTFDDINLTIQCRKEDKMRNICEKFAKEKKRYINSLLFLYEGNQVNFDLSFLDQAISLDRNNNEMNILVYEKKTIN